MKKTASTEAAACRIDGAQDEKKEILVKTLLEIAEGFVPEAVNCKPQS